MKSRVITSVSVILTVLLLDIIIKHAVMANMELGERIEITSWFQLYYTENQGMAFGMSFVGTWVLALFRLVAVGLFGWYLSRCIKHRYPMGYIVCIALVIAGAVGNIIDNVFAYGTGEWLNGRVVDMFYFPLFTWPDWMPLVGGDIFFGAVFNFADAAISCAVIAILMFYTRFLNHNHD